MTSSAVLETPVISSERAAQLFTQPAMTTIRWATYEWAAIGLAPLLFDRMTTEEIIAMKTKQKISYPVDETMETVALRKMYSDEYEDPLFIARTPTGKFVIPQDNLFAALRDAGESCQYGSGKNDRVTLSTKGTMFSWMIQLHEPCFEVLGLDGNSAKWEVDVRKGNATQGTGAVCIIRPRFDEWGIVGHLDLNIDLLSEEKLRELFTIAGMKCGLCSARPGKKMRFGIFTLTHLKWIGGAEPKSATRSNGANASRPKRGKKASKTNGDGDSENEN